MNRYEGMFIFTQSVKTDDVDDALVAVRQEIEKLGGSVDSSTRLGKRTFARPLRKQEAGEYAVVNFRLAGGDLDALRARYKLSEQVLRTQFMRLGDRAGEATRGKSDG